MSDVVHLIYSTQNIDNGGARVEAPKGLGVEAITGVSAPNYEIDTYSTDLPTTGTIFDKYDPRFTGCPPCNDC
jgi:hypothetical protein